LTEEIEEEVEVLKASESVIHGEGGENHSGEESSISISTDEQFLSPDPFSLEQKIEKIKRLVKRKRIV
jgi:hypothetical protein